MGGGGFMADPRITIGLSPVVMDKLDRLCEEKGLKRPALLSIAIDKLWKEEHPDEK
mgnify:CR=1 FL=1